MLATLASLRIRNLALVEDLLWQPGPGLVAITGETGAGKSILIGALQLLLGERADKALIRSGADACAVEAVFEMPDSAAFDEWLGEQGCEPCADGQLLLKRTLSASSAGRQFVNGSPCTLATLKHLGDRLVDLHGPHDHQSLFSQEEQTRVLDAFAGATGLAGDCRKAFRERQRFQEEVARLRDSDKEAGARRDLLRHVAGEIAAARLVAGEEEALMMRLRTASQGRRLVELAGEVLGALGGDRDGGVRPALAAAVKAARELGKIDESRASCLEQLEEAAASLSDVESDVRRYAESVECDPETLRELEDRADTIQSLKRKYGGTVEDVIARGESAARELEEIESLDARMEEAEAAAAEAVESFRKLARKLSAARTKAAPVLAKAVTEELRDLGLAKAGFSVLLDSAEEARGSEGGRADFQFAPNPGEPAKPLRSIASSGEISRVMLALKSVLAGQDGVPLLVFDEIDANVGGEVAVKVGRKMRALADSHQVLCITHLPQVAAAAHRHHAVAKQFEGGRTTTQVDELHGTARVAELARMLGGQESESALAHARSLLGGGE